MKANSRLPAVVYALFCEKNRKIYTEACLGALAKQDYRDLVIVVVDDNSDDGTLEMIKRKFPSVIVLHGNGDLWWSGGMRLGFEYILKVSKKDDFVITLNNDTVFSQGFVSQLVSSCQKNSLSPVGSIGVSNKTKEVLYHVHKQIGGKTRPHKLKDDFDSESLLYNTDCLNGKGTILPVEVIRKVGNFSTLFPHYAADWDYFYRVKKKGYTLAVDPQSIVYSLDDDKNLTERIMEKDKISLRDFTQLFFSRRSSFNLYSTLLHIILYIPFPKKLLGIYKTLIMVPKVFINKLILPNINR